MNFTFLALAVFAITVFGSKLDVLLNALEEELARRSARTPSTPDVNFQKFWHGGKWFFVELRNGRGIEKQDYKKDLQLGMRKRAKVPNTPDNAHVTMLKVNTDLKRTVGMWSCNKGYKNTVTRSGNRPVVLYMFTNIGTSIWSASTAKMHGRISKPSTVIDCQCIYGKRC